MTNKELEIYFNKRVLLLNECNLYLPELAQEDYILRLEFMGLFETEYFVRGFKVLGTVHHG